MAGGAPGLFDELGDAFSWAKGSTFDPIASFLAGQVNEVTRRATEAVGGFFSVAGWHIYKLLGSFPGPGWPSPGRAATPEQTRFINAGFAPPDLLKGLTPWYYLQRVGSMLWYFVKGAVGEAAGWLGDWVWRVGQGVEGRVGAVGDWLWGLVKGGFAFANQLLRDSVGWVADWVWKVGVGVEGRVSAAGDWLWGLAKGGFDFTNQLLRDSTGWLWDQTKAGFDATIAEIPRAVIAGGAAIGDVIFDAVKWFVESSFTPYFGLVNNKLEIPFKLLRAEYSSIEELFDDMLDPPEEMLKGWTGALLLPFIVVGLLVNMVTGLSGPLLEPVLQEQARNVGARIPPFAMLRDGLLRGEMSEGVHDDWMGRFGYEAANIRVQKALYQQIPSPTDLVRMGVREVFTPAIAERFGQFEDFPPAFGQWMGKQGFDEFWSKSYWGAHWDLPSTMQGFEMLHRGVIHQGELNLLLRALDVMPFWRDKLTQISYNPFTRVDVRRMYSAGVIERGEVERTYRALGYAPADAVTLTDWVIKAFPRKTDDPNAGLRGLSLGTIKQAYARRLIDRETALEDVIELDYAPDDADLIITNWEFEWTVDPGARSDLPLKDVGVSVIERAYERRLIEFNAGITELTEMGFTPEDARLRLQLVDLGLEEQLANLQIDAALNDFENGLITDAQFAARLADINVPRARIDFLVEREILSREVKNQRLTLAQMKKAVAAGLMGEDEYRSRLDARGYNVRDVEILVALEVEAV